MWLLFVVLVIFSPDVSLADVGIPVVSFGFPLMIVNLIFVVIIEWLFFWKLRRSVSSVDVLKQVFLANLITTFIGYPLIAGATALSALFGLHIGWLLPYDRLPKMNFYIGTAMLLTLIPCYFLSVWIEGGFLRRKFGARISWRQVFLANFASYIFLLAQVYTQFPVHPLDYSRFTAEPAYVAIMAIAQILSGR